MARWLLHILIISSLHLISPSSQKETRFVYEDFLDREDLYLDGSAKVVSGGSLQLTNTSKYQIGHAFYDKPVKISSSFSTHFVCVLVPKKGVEGGHGIAFLVSPSMDFSHAQPTRYLGVFDASTIKSHVLAVELDTIWNPEFNDVKGGHVGIDVNSPVSVTVASASYYSDIENKNESVNLLSGKTIQVWVDYEDNMLSVWISPLDVKKPSRPLLSHPINLAEIFRNISNLYVGFSASTGNAVSDQYILGWSFSTDRESLQRLDISKISELPYPTGTDKKLLALFIILFGCLAIVALIILA